MSNNNIGGGGDTLTRLNDVIAPYNKKNIPLEPSTAFASDLDLDSLTIMDMVAAIEDEWDIVLPLNMLPDLETIQQVADLVNKITGKK
ncbi:MAG: phosphopantetheine-binding protein [Sphingomonadales bacterium]